MGCVCAIHEDPEYLGVRNQLPVHRHHLLLESDDLLPQRGDLTVCRQGGRAWRRNQLTRSQGAPPPTSGRLLAAAAAEVISLRMAASTGSKSSVRGLHRNGGSRPDQIDLASVRPIAPALIDPY